MTALSLSSCEEDIDLSLPPAKPELVVEAYIEPNVPPVVILTRNAAYFGKLNIGDLSNFFVHDAKMTVTDDQGRIAPLQEISLASLPDPVEEVILQMLGLDKSAAGRQFYFYTITANNPLVGQVNGRYRLDIETEGKKLWAQTSIPDRVPLDSVWAEPQPDPALKDWAQVMIKIKDPDTAGNAYRYFTQVFREPMLAGFTSVIDDAYFNGKEFHVPLPRGTGQTAPIDPQTVGLYHRGDTVTIKWTTLDKASFRFWRSAELQFGTASNPFGSLIRIPSNVNGGLGVFTGYGAFYRTIVIGE